MNNYQSLINWSANSDNKKIIQVNKILQHLPDPNIFTIGSIERVNAERKLKILKKEAEELGYNESFSKEIAKEITKEVGIHELGISLGIGI